MSIDSCYESLIAKLTSQGEIVTISKTLKTLTDERVLYVYELISKLNCFPHFLEAVKSADVSTYYRNHGNQYYQQRRNYQAWQYFNLALLYAPKDSEVYAVALSNRSAVFFDMKKYKECVKDIEEVFSRNCPEKLKGKLTKRLETCNDFLSKLQSKLNNEKNIAVEKLVQVQSERDKIYTCASEKLLVVTSEEMGRHVIASEDIKVGEVLVEEEPYMSLLQKDQFLFSCSYCLSRKPNLLPCDKCCFTLYCSEECKSNAWKDYHRVECNLMAALIDLKFTKLELLGLRTAIKARNDHNNWEELYKTIEDAESNSHTEHRGCVQKDGQWLYDSKYYTSTHMLATNIEKRSISDIFQKSVTAAVFLKLLSEKTSLFNDADEKSRICMSKLLLLHLMTSPTNMHGLSTNCPTDEGKYTDEVSLASGSYAFHSLLNHSCAPNVVRSGKLGSGRMILVALRPIKKGMQIFDNYGSHHALEDRSSRQSSLKFQYKFICNCEACTNNWPTYLAMKIQSAGQKVPRELKIRTQKILNSHAIQMLEKGDMKTAIDLYKPLCKLAEDLDAYAPCEELGDCQESLKQCLVIFEGVVPYRCSELVQWDARPVVSKK